MACKGTISEFIARLKTCVNTIHTFKSFRFVHTRGLQTSLSEGHISYYTTVRGPDVLCNVIVSKYATFYQINKCFVNILYFAIEKMS